MNTRFNPTVNGPLHAGHLYLILLNHHAARSSGGKFVLRFDDDQPYWDQFCSPAKVAEYTDGIRRDLEWLGLEPDFYSSERDSREVNENWVRTNVSNSDFIFQDREYMGIRWQPTVKTNSRPYPYTPYLTAVKVAQDFREGIDLLIRGEDLVTEVSLYCYFCEVAGIPRPGFQYVPRMMRSLVPYGSILTDLAEVSKTVGGYAIEEYRRRGWSPGSLVTMVAASALEEPCSGWTFENVKKQPILKVSP